MTIYGGSNENDQNYKTGYFETCESANRRVCVFEGEVEQKKQTPPVKGEGKGQVSTTSLMWTIIVASLVSSVVTSFVFIGVGYKLRQALLNRSA